jgi:hypothetical protein
MTCAEAIATWRLAEDAGGSADIARLICGKRKGTFKRRRAPAACSPALACRFPASNGSPHWRVLRSYPGAYAGAQFAQRRGNPPLLTPAQLMPKGWSSHSKVFDDHATMANYLRYVREAE